MTGLIRTGLPALIAAVAAVIFGLLSPGPDEGWADRLHWAALGGVLWGLAAYIILRRLEDGKPWDAALPTKVGATVLLAVPFALKWLFSAAPKSRPPVLRVIVAATAVLATFLVLTFSEKSDRLASTIFTVVLAVTLIAAVWIFLNVVVANARKDWGRFSALTAGIVAAIAFAIMRGNISLQSLIAEEDLTLFGAGSGFLGHVEWPLFGAVLWGGGVYVMRQFGSRLIRIVIGIAIGVVTGWQIGDNSLLWQRPQISWSSAILWTLVFAALGGAWRMRKSFRSGRLDDRQLDISQAVPGVITGAAIGFVIATWLRAPFIGDGTDVLLSAAIPLALLGVRIAWQPDPGPTQLAGFENRAQAFIFLGPALLFLSSALVIPAFRTIFLSTLDRNFNSRNFEGETFDGFNAQGDAFVGFDNYRELFRDVDTFQLANWRNIFTSQLFWVALVLVVGGLIAGLVSGTKRNGERSYIGTGSSVGSLAFGVLLLAFAVFSVLRGTFFNNLWWVVTVTTLSVVLGLTIAVLSERAGRFESVAKSLIFMPMAISFVGASIVWRLQYQPRDISKKQTGVLNAAWVELGNLSYSGLPRTIVLIALAALLAYVALRGIERGLQGMPFGAHVGGLIVIGYLFVELLRRSLGGFQFTADGTRLPDTIVFLQEPPFNNVFLMVILIWIQTGFAMVILSAAIKAVPTELTEAAKVDGADESQSFFQVVLPQILPTIGVVATTLIVLVSKVFDIVKVSTGGNFGTNVLANDMVEVSFSFGNFTLGSAIAVFILVSVLPVMFLNVRRMQKARI